LYVYYVTRLHSSQSIAATASGQVMKAWTAQIFLEKVTFENRDASLEF
jgi:hypothetical protein